MAFKYGKLKLKEHFKKEVFINTRNPYFLQKFYEKHFILLSLITDITFNNFIY